MVFPGVFPKYPRMSVLQADWATVHTSKITCAYLAEKSVPYLIATF